MGIGAGLVSILLQLIALGKTVTEECIVTLFVANGGKNPSMSFSV